MQRWRVTGTLTVAACALGVAAAPAQAALTFSGPTTSPAGYQPQAIAAADFNRDGRIDVAALNQAPEAGVSVLRGTGSGSFLAPTKTVLGGDPRDVAAGDLNRDGRPDLVVGDIGTETVQVLLGNGSGGFAAPVGYAAGTNPHAVEVADFNGDGKPDVAAANEEHATASVLLGTGTGTLGARTASFIGNVPRDLAAGDLDADGDLDLAAALNVTQVAVALGTGTGGFQHPSAYDSVQPQSSVTVADLNGDGRLDIAAGQPSSGTVAVHLWDGLNWTLSARYAAPSAAVVDAHDMDADGDVDLVASGSARVAGAVSFHVLRNTGSGAFTPIGFGAGSGQMGPIDLALADLDGDGRRDVVLADASEGTVTVFRNTSTTSRSYADTVLADAPRGYWRVGEASGTTALDASPFANHGQYLNGRTLGRPGALIGDPNTAVGLDGTNDWIRVVDRASLDLGDSFTLEAWVRRDTARTVHQLFNKGAGSFQLVVQPASRGNQVWLRAAGSSTVARTDAGIPADGRYHHVVVTKDGPAVQFFLDGVPVPTVLVTPKVLRNTTAPLAVSAASASGGAIDGDVDELAVYDAALTSGQVAAHFAAATGG